LERASGIIPWLVTQKLSIRQLNFNLRLEYFSTADMVVAGKYDEIDPSILRFPLAPVTDKEIGGFEGALFQSKCAVHIDDVLNGITSYQADGPWDAAGISHILAFGQYWSDEQRKCSIVAAGFSGKVHGNSVVPRLTSSDSGKKRILDLVRSVSFPQGTCFLAVKSL